MTYGWDVDGLAGSLQALHDRRPRAAVADEPRQHVAEPLLRGQLGVLRDRRRQQRPCPRDICLESPDDAFQQ